MAKRQHALLVAATETLDAELAPPRPEALVAEMSMVLPDQAAFEEWFRIHQSIWRPAGSINQALFSVWLKLRGQVPEPSKLITAM